MANDDLSDLLSRMAEDAGRGDGTDRVARRRVAPSAKASAPTGDASLHGDASDGPGLMDLVASADPAAEPGAKPGGITGLDDLLQLNDADLMLVIGTLATDDLLVVLSDRRHAALKRRVMAGLAAESADYVRQNLDLLGECSNAAMREAVTRVVRAAEDLRLARRIAWSADRPTVAPPPAAPARTATADPAPTPVGPLPPSPAGGGTEAWQIMPQLMELLSMARRDEDALHALAGTIGDDLLRTGVRLLADGSPPATVDEILAMRRQAMLAAYQRRLDLIVAAVQALQNQEKPAVFAARAVGYLV